MLVAQPFFLVRTPALSFDTVTRLVYAPDADLLTFFADAALQEALFIASPDLHAAYQKWLATPAPDPHKTARLRLALAKYLLRMAYRCTPFGLFSAVSLGSWGTRTALVVAAAGQHRRHTRLDMDYLCGLGQALQQDPTLQPLLRYYPNTTLYRSQEKWRLVEYRLAERQRTHHLVEIGADTSLDTILALAQAGATMAELTAALTSETIEAEEAYEFVQELIEAQLLISQLEPNVTGQEYFARLQATLNATTTPAPHLAALMRQLEQVQQQLTQLDQAATANDVAQYQKLVRQLGAATAAPVHVAQLFQVDMHKPTAQASLRAELAEEFAQAVQLLASVGPPAANASLEEFKRAFRTRYDARPVPLLEVLDSESGLGYPLRSNVSGAVPLLGGLAFPAAPAPAGESVSWNRWSQFIFDQYLQARMTNQTVIRLDAASVAPYLQDVTPQLPRALYATGYVLAAGAAAVDSDEYKVVFKEARGPSSINVLSRFCHLDETMAAHVQQALAAEAAAYEPAILAEVVHLNQARVGNILRRPTLHQYEIPILVHASTTDEYTISLQDLELSLVDNQLVLRSRRLDRQVIPRLSTAHNYTLDALPAYHFLGDLQNQLFPSVWYWDWPGGGLAGADFLPRVEYGRLILSPARWLLTGPELETVQQYGPSTAAAVRELRHARQIPRWVCVRQGDNELPLDLADDLALQVLADFARGKARIALQECLRHPDNSWVTDTAGQCYTHELVIPFINPQGRTEAAPVSAPAAAPGPRRFAPGSEWLYCKIYCGPRTADRILLDVIEPLLEQLKAGGQLQQWFFIRYSDPDFHLRVRFRGPAVLAGGILEQLHALLQPYLEAGAVARIATDVYEQEVERYGALNMDHSEALFDCDSEFSLRVLSALALEPDANSRWLVTLRAIDDLLTSFGLLLEQKQALLQRLQRSFAAEFNAGGKEARKMLAAKYRAHRAAIQAVMTMPELPADAAWRHRRLQLQQLAGPIMRNVSQGLSLTMTGVLSSYIHMFLNRFLHTEHRRQEFVIYDMLTEHYTSLLALQAARQSKQA